MDGDATITGDAAAGRLAADLLARSRLLAPEQIADALADAAAPLGVMGARIYLADLQDQRLRALPGGKGHAPEVLAIDSTAAGLAYQTTQVHSVPVSEGGADRQAWIPLTDGTERLGVLELTVAETNGVTPAHLEMLASLAGLILASKNPGSDTYARGRRSRQLALQAELVWALLAPRTFAADRVTVAAALEPAYEVGGDAYDYSLTGDHLHVSLYDAVGHDLGAGLLTSVAMAACRSTRRSGGTLHDIAARADHAISRQFGDSLFVTALLCDLNVATGEFSWIPCGHHPPLLIRSNNTARELARPPRLPLGLAGNETGAGRSAPERAATGDEQFLAYTEQVEPGDRILLYTDGVTEARAADGTQFGLGLLTEFVIRHSQSGTPAPEMLRHLSKTITDHQHGPLLDDATIVLIDWTPTPGPSSQ